MDMDFSFNPNEKIESNLIPDGTYPAIVTAAETKVNKKGTGLYLKLTFQITDGEYQNRLIFINCNIKNDNATAENLAKKFLRQLCMASNIVTEIKDAQALITNVPVMISTKIRKSSDPQYDDQVDIAAIAKVGFTTATAAPQTARPQWSAPTESGADPF